MIEVHMVVWLLRSAPPILAGIESKRERAVFGEREIRGVGGRESRFWYL